VSGGSTVIEAAHTNVLGSNAHWRAVPGELQLFGGPSRNIDKFIWNGLSVQGLNSRLSCWLPALNVALREGLEKTAWIEKTAQSLATGEGCSL
jgi:hypothetical protein